MLINPTTITSGSVLRADVAVVGSGPAGLTLANECAAAGNEVLLLETGGRHSTREVDDQLRGQGSGKPVELVRSRRRAFGGTSSHWEPDTGLRMRPFDPIDFTARTARSDASWPFSRDVLDRYYRRVHEGFGIPEDYDRDRWPVDGSTNLAWRDGPELAMFRFAEHDVFVNQLDDVIASRNVSLLLNATCRRIDIGPDTRTVTSLSMVGPDGQTFTVEARVFVLAAGGIDNARLLLASPGPTGAGVGNEHDNVGRYFMDHLAVDTGVLVPLGDPAAIGAGSFLPFRHSPIYRSQPMLWLGNERIERSGLLNAAFWLTEVDADYLSPGVGGLRSLRGAMHSTPPGPLLPHVASAARGIVPLTTFALRRLTHRPARQRALSLRIVTEQLPDRNSRVRLSRSCDATGVPRVDVDWRIASSDLDLIRAHQDELSRLLEDRGVARIDDRFDVRTQCAPVMPMYHHIGTTRMHRDPRHGVVDADLRVHSTSNLFVAGSSVFPTGGYVNPTLTIIALAHRLADRVSQSLGAIQVAACR